MNLKLGERQIGMLDGLLDHGYWHDHWAGCGWVWNTPLGTVRILESLLTRGLVERTPQVINGSNSWRYTINKAGLNALRVSKKEKAKPLPIMEPHIPKEVAAMLGYALDFTPPMEGFTGRFNTFRLGKKWATRLKVGDVIFLIDKNKSAVFGRARVLAGYTGTLAECAKVHARDNHNQKGKGVRAAPKRLMENMLKRYGPHIVHPGKLTTVIYLELIQE